MAGITRKIGILGVAFSLAAFGLGQSPAHADAFGVTGIFYETISISIGPVSVGIPTGTFAHRITGDGTRVDTQVANFAPVAGVGLLAASRCDWEIRFIGRNAAGATTNLFRGPRHSGRCDLLGKRQLKNKTYSSDTTSICALLIQQGTEIARQCHRTA